MYIFFLGYALKCHGNLIQIIISETHLYTSTNTAPSVMYKKYITLGHVHKIFKVGIRNESRLNPEISKKLGCLWQMLGCQAGAKYFIVSGQAADSAIKRTILFQSRFLLDRADQLLDFGVGQLHQRIDDDRLSFVSSPATPSDQLPDL